jgi:hypothetical protein
LLDEAEPTSVTTKTTRPGLFPSSAAVSIHPECEGGDLNPYALSGASTSIGENPGDGGASAGKDEPPQRRSPTVAQGAGDSLAIAFDAIAGALRTALASGDAAAVRQLRAAMDALLAPLDAASPPPADEREGGGGAS